MKKILKLRTAISLAMCVMLTLALFSACSKEESDPRDNYVGSWRVTERITGYSEVGYYNITIVKSSIDPKGIVINNFFDVSSVALIARVDGNTFDIPQQTFVDVGFSGSGNRDGNTLHWSVLANVTGGITLNLLADAVKM